MPCRTTRCLNKERTKRDNPCIHFLSIFLIFFGSTLCTLFSLHTTSTPPPPNSCNTHSLPKKKQHLPYCNDHYPPYCDNHPLYSNSNTLLCRASALYYLSTEKMTPASSAPLQFTFPERQPSLLEMQLGLDNEEETSLEDMLRASAILTYRQRMAVPIILFELLLHSVICCEWLIQILFWPADPTRCCGTSATISKYNWFLQESWCASLSTSFN